jgi:Sec7-like guanine-nucleotide exchange factor
MDSRVREAVMSFHVIEEYLYKFKLECLNEISRDILDREGKKRLRKRLKELVSEVTEEFAEIVSNAMESPVEDIPEALCLIEEIMSDLPELYSQIREEEISIMAERWNERLAL